jgi:site-specific DNA-methyltransferase (adenine-specific)
MGGEVLAIEARAPNMFRTEQQKCNVGSLKERWCTPPEIFTPRMQEFHFDLDAAADWETKRYTIDNFSESSLDSKEWQGERIWLNPPYGRKLEPFVRRAQTEAFKGKLVAALIPFRCRAAWWHECVLYRAPEVRCYRKRIRFLRPDGTRGDYTTSCDSCLVVWRGSWSGITSMVTA